jgi:hypothetical protein
MRRTIEQRALVQRLDEGEGKPVFGFPRQPDLDIVLVPDHCRSMDHLAAPRLRVLGAEEHDPEKCAAAFGKDHAQTRSQRVG